MHRELELLLLLLVVVVVVVIYFIVNHRLLFNKHALNMLSCGAYVGKCGLNLACNIYHNHIVKGSKIFNF